MWKVNVELKSGAVPDLTQKYIARRWQFSHKETLYHTFFERSAILDENWPFCIFETLLEDLGATYDDHLRLIGKRVLDFLLVLIELFLLDFTAEELRANIA